MELVGSSCDIGRLGLTKLCLCMAPFSRDIFLVATGAGMRIVVVEWSSWGFD